MGYTLQASFESLGARWGITQTFARDNGSGVFIQGYASVLDETMVELSGLFGIIHGPGYPGDDSLEGTPIPYPYLGWPIVLTVPGDIYNAQTSDEDPDYEYGGKYVVSGMVEKLSGHTLTYAVDGEGGYTPVLDHGWEFKVVSQRCWVILLMAPSMTRPADPPWDGAPEDKPTYWHDDPWEEPLGYGQTYWFGVRYMRGPGSGTPGVGLGSSGTAGGGVPASVTVETGSAASGVVPVVNVPPVGGPS